MTGEQLASIWQTRTSGCGTALGSWQAVARLATQLAAAGVPVTRLGTELLARLDDPDSLAEAADSRSPEAAETVRLAVTDAFEQWLSEAAAETGPLAVRDLELAVAERLELARLAELNRPVLVLAPGRAARKLARLYATGPYDGVPLAPAIAPKDATWELSSDSDSMTASPRDRESA